MAENKNETKKKDKKTENTVEEVKTDNDQAAADESKAVKELEKQVEELKKELDHTKDNLLRTIAEYDNFRKRSQKEKEAIYSDSRADIISKLLPSVDNFERAEASATDLDSYKKGIDMTVKGLLDAITLLGVEAFGEVGDTFDPNIHNAVMHIDDEELAENSVCEVFLKGYKLGDRVIRHATVKVAN